MILRHFVGLDLAQAHDWTALCVLQSALVNLRDEPKDRRPVYSVPHLRRFPLGTSYVQMVEEVARLLDAPPIKVEPPARGKLWATPPPFLVIDATGVGRPVVDMFRDRLVNRVTCRMCAVTITGGNRVNRGTTGGWNVPKKDLVGVLQSLLSSRRLQIAKSLPEAALLVKEMENFKVKITAAANETFEAWREGDHDDLVLAVALAAWVAEKHLPGLGEREQRPGPKRVRP